jgi:acetyl-CoA acetyltransferase
MKPVAITGLGVTKQGIVPGHTSEEFALQAIEAAICSAGLSRSDIGAYLFQPGIGGGGNGRAADLAGLGTNVVLELQSGGATAILCIATAIGIIEAGLARHVVCAYGTNARSREVVVGSGRRPSQDPRAVFGMFSPGATAALAASAYLAKYGRDSSDLAHIAVALRAHGALREDAAMYGKPITVDDHQASSFIVEPLRKLDYCLVSDGGAAFIVSASETLADVSVPPVFVAGLGAVHESGVNSAGGRLFAAPDLDVSAARDAAFGRAGVGVQDIDVFEFYDAFTILVAQQLEGYGLCEQGQGTELPRSGGFRFDSPTPCNTSGTEHSWSYLQGFTHISEAVRQLRGEAGATQARQPRTALTTGIGSADAGLSVAAAVLTLDRP